MNLALEATEGKGNPYLPPELSNQNPVSHQEIAQKRLQLEHAVLARIFDAPGRVAPHLELGVRVFQKIHTGSYSYDVALHDPQQFLQTLNKHLQTSDFAQAFRLYDMYTAGMTHIQHVIPLEQFPDQHQAWVTSWQALWSLLKSIVDKTVIAAASLKEGKFDQMDPFAYEVVRYSEGQDSVLIVAPTAFRRSQRFQQALLEINKVFHKMRSRNQPTPQNFSLFMYQTPQRGWERPHGSLLNNPDLFISVDSPFFIQELRHELIHCMFGAEVGEAIVSDDFVEGCAMRIGASLGVPAGEADYNDPTRLIGVQELKSAHTQQLAKIGSHTQFVGELGQTQSTREYSYLFGYVLVDAIIQSSRYQQLLGQAQTQGEPPFSIFYKLHRDLTAGNVWSANLLYLDPQTGAYRFRNHEVLNHVLAQNGFDLGEIQAKMSAKLKEIRDQERAKQVPLQELTSDQSAWENSTRPSIKFLKFMMSIREKLRGH